MSLVEKPQDKTKESPTVPTPAEQERIDATKEDMKAVEEDPNRAGLPNGLYDIELGC